MRCLQSSSVATVAMAILVAGVVSSAGKAQQAGVASDGRPPAVPAEFLATPRGWFHPSCVVEIRDDEYLDAEDNIIDANGVARPLSRCLHPHYDKYGNQNHAPTANGWDGDVQAQPGAGSWISALWSVPNNPTNVGSQVVYFFPGLEPLTDAFGGFILQPVLGWNHINTGPGWTIASWNCCRQQNALHSPLVPVNAGNNLYGYVWGTGCNAATGVCTGWQVFASVAGGAQTTLNTDAYGDVMNSDFSGVLESYNINTCDQYPPNQTITYSSVVVHDINGNTIQPTWQGALIGQIPSCSVNVNWANTTATITWCIPAGWPNNPNCAFHCGQQVSDGCGGTSNCPAQHSCPLHYIWDDSQCYCTQ